MDKKIEMSQFKTIKISPKLHNDIKEYCNKNSYKMNNWIEKQLEKIINSLNDKKNN